MTRAARQVHVERLTLDLEGVSARSARTAMAQLAPALAQALAARPAFLRGARPMPDRPDAEGLPAGQRDDARVDAGRLELSGAAEGAALASAIAARIADALASAMNRERAAASSLPRTRESTATSRLNVPSSAGDESRIPGLGGSSTTPEGGRR
jgi:hypothetical protein